MTSEQRREDAERTLFAAMRDIDWLLERLALCDAVVKAARAAHDALDPYEDTRCGCIQRWLGDKLLSETKCPVGAALDNLDSEVASE